MRRFAEPKPKNDLHFMLDLYARLVAARCPLDAEIAAFLRLRSAISHELAGKLVGDSARMVRRRWRLLQELRWCQQRVPLFAIDDLRELPFTPLEESACALYVDLREAGGQTPLGAKNTIVAALEYLSRWTGSPRIRVMEPKGEPEAKLREFQIRYEADRTLPNAPEADRRSHEFSLPPDLVTRWFDRFGGGDAVGLCRAMGTSAALDLRVNTLTATRDEVLARLAADKMKASATPHSPVGVRLAERSRIVSHELHKTGAIEMQDEGSQLVSLVVDPRPNWKVLDACAGAGGKSLHLAALMGGRGELFVHDREAHKLEELRLRARRANAGNIRVVQPGGLRGHFDAVLVDAPCLGLGTLRRNPDLAWRGAVAPRAAEMAERQRECINEYAQLVKPGGVLVYTVCSFEPEECAIEPGEGFVPDAIGPVLARVGLGELAGEGHTLMLRPDKHGTDGFFISRWRRKG